MTEFRATLSTHTYQASWEISNQKSVLGDLASLVKEQSRIEELEQENVLLKEFILQVSERLFLASEVLSIKAEKKEKRKSK